MNTQEKQAPSGNGVAIVAIVAIFVLILGTVMLFAQEEPADTPDAAVGPQQKKESFAFELQHEDGSVHVESEG